MSENDKAVFVYTTWPTLADATQAGQRLVETELAACVNILPGMTSIYRWQGKVESGSEAVMIVKTVSPALPSVERMIRALHPANTPAIATVDISGGGADFLAWISANCRTNGC